MQVRADLFDTKDNDGVDEVDGGSTQHNNILKEIPVEKETHKLTNNISKVKIRTWLILLYYLFFTRVFMLILG